MKTPNGAQNSLPLKPTITRSTNSHPTKPTSLSWLGLGYSLLLAVCLSAAMWCLTSSVGNTYQIEAAQENHFGLLNAFFKAFSFSDDVLKVLGFVVLSLCVIPLWMVAEKKLGRNLALWFVTAIVFQPLLWQVASTSFSPVILVTLLTGFYIAAAESKKLITATILLVVILLADEVGWMLVGVLASIFAFSQRKLVYWLHVLLVLIAFLMVWLILPHQTQDACVYRVNAFGIDNPLSWVAQMLLHPIASLRLMLQPSVLSWLALLLLPLLFLPIMNPRSAIALILWFILLILSSSSTKLSLINYLPGFMLACWGGIITLYNIRNRLWSYRGFNAPSWWWGLPLLCCSLVLWLTLMGFPYLWSFSH